MARKPALIKTLTLLVAPTVVVVLVVIVLMVWRVPAKVEIELTADRAQFTIDTGAERERPSWVRIMGDMPAQSIGLEHFREVTFQPATLEVGDWSHYDFETRQFAELAWAPVELQARQLGITPRSNELNPKLTIRGTATGSGGAREVDSVRVSPETIVTLEVRGERNQALTVKLEKLGPGLSPVAVSVAGPVELIARHSELNGIQDESRLGGDQVALRASFGEGGETFQAAAREGVLVLNLRRSQEEVESLAFATLIRVSEIHFTRQGEGNRLESTLVRNEPAEIRYADYPERRVTFAAPHFIGLDELEQFQITHIDLDPGRRGLHFRLEGTAGHLRTGTSVDPKDHRMTAFDAVWDSPRLMILFSIVVWVFPTTLGAYRLYQGLKKRTTSLEHSLRTRNTESGQ